MPPKSRQAQKVEMVKSGEWPDFLKRRDYLMSTGVPEGAAWTTALLEITKTPALPTGTRNPAYTPAANRKSNERAELLKQAESDRVPGTTFSGKTASSIEVIEWVAANIAITDPDPKKAPNSEAWGLLQWVRRDQQNEGEFWRQIYPKLMPTKSEMKKSQGEKENESDVIDLIGRVKAAIISDEGAAEG